MLTSVDPTGGSSAWQAYGSQYGIPDATGIPGMFQDVSSPSATLCVAVDALGNVATSTDPTGGAGAWHSVHIDGWNSLQAVSCAPQGRLCAETDNFFNVLTSTNPVSARPAWSATKVGIARYISSPISCPAVSLCVGARRALREYQRLGADHDRHQSRLAGGTVDLRFFCLSARPFGRRSDPLGDRMCLTRAVRCVRLLRGRLW